MLGNSNQPAGPHANARLHTSVERLPFVQYREITLPSWAGDDDQFVLCPIRGDTLLEAGIRDGDTILVYVTENVSEGDLVAIRTPLGLLVKYLSLSQDGTLTLQGTNGPARTFSPNQVHIEGRFVRREY